MNGNACQSAAVERTEVRAISGHQGSAPHSHRGDEYRSIFFG